MNPHQNLHILQYNVCRKNSTIAPLLWGLASKKLDVVTVQELWQNSHQQTLYNLPGSCFYLAFTLTECTYVCFYINKIDKYLEYLDNFLQEVASKYTQLQKQSGHSVPWWNQEIQNKVREERKVRRQVLREQTSQEDLEQATKNKKKAVREGKQNTFRQQVHELASSSKFWKLAKWGKTKANRTSDLSLVPDLET